MNDERGRTTTHASQAGPGYAADGGAAAQDCECEFCSPEPEPIPAPWERNGDPEHDLRPLSMSAAPAEPAEPAESDETPTLSLVPISPR
ncbi:hypothetical protein [Actinocrinis sp.]|uniref:hypothetical protein n=1 Tax=Actinocrinis sp. TaxID=1920516 RepID=UPI002D2D1684|nr:hypothetical protein [Actinocrinis sp.]HZP53391.1 hypothetical protein [Actinocrinis sp.]